MSDEVNDELKVGDIVLVILPESILDSWSDFHESYAVIRKVEGLPKYSNTTYIVALGNKEEMRVRPEYISKIGKVC